MDVLFSDLVHYVLNSLFFFLGAKRKREKKIQDSILAEWQYCSLLCLHQNVAPCWYLWALQKSGCCLVPTKFCLSNSVHFRKARVGENEKCTFRRKSAWSPSLWKPRDLRLADKGLYGSNSHSELQCNEGMQVNYPSVCVSIAVNYSIHRWQLIGVEWK